MRGTFRSKNGATLSGHSDMWSDKNRSANSHDAGNGRHGKRSQGTGIQGKLNTMPSDGVDTSKMKPEEKLKYFNSLGLMPGKGVAPDAQPPAKEVHKDPVANSRNKVQALTQDLAKVFADKPNYLTSLVQELKAVEPAKFKSAVFAAYRAMQEVTAQDNVAQADILEHILSAIRNSSID